MVLASLNYGCHPPPCIAYRKINTEVSDQNHLISHNWDLFDMILRTSMLDHEIRTY
jgi:hypothetical protein